MSQFVWSETRIVENGEVIGGSWDGFAEGLRGVGPVIRLVPRVAHTLHEDVHLWKDFKDLPKDVRLEVYHWRVFYRSGNRPQQVGLWIHEDLLEQTDLLCKIAQSHLRKR